MLGVKVEVESMCGNVQRLTSNLLFNITFSGAQPHCLHTGGGLAPVALPVSIPMTPVHTISQDLKFTSTVLLTLL